MSSQTSVNISSGEANRSGSDIQGPPQDRNQPEMDTIEDLRKKLQALEKKKLELTKQHNQDMSHYEKDLMKLRLELERGEALRRVLESEMSLARKDAQVQMYSAEDEICDAKAKLLELQARSSEPRQHTLTYGSEESIWFSFPHEENVTPRGPAPDVHRVQPRQRHCTFSGSDVPSPGTLYVTCPSPGTSTASESFQPPFVPQGISSPRAPARHVHWGQPTHITYYLSESGTPSGRASYGISSSTGSDTTTDSVPSFFIPRGVSTPVAPAPDACWRELSDEVFTSGRELSDEVFTPGRELSDEVFTSGAESEFDPSYSRHFGLLRPATNETTDLIHYRRSDTDLYDVLWITREPSLLKIPLPSGRSGKTYSLQRPTTTTYVQVCPSRIETISWLDDSSRIRPLSTFTMSTPSWERIRAPVGAPVHPPAPVNASFRGRQRRAHSLPPFKSVSQDTSSNPRSTQDI
ncbi:uncharacterized protein LOC130265556 [Oenanthe melanoleuca]|uniref:uncharacterized protein LOC130265556 n=1 Tax=Oenanthe melanoleuca TaxID=2939378 RepID=UPI0024C1FE24|nr:uncharacterized protein LOC130265556 [Oenanthe melanoleuca]